MNAITQTVTLCADPEVKTYGSENKSIINFNGAVNKRFFKEGDDSADFFQYVAYGKTADFIGKYFKKGSKMLITGELINNNFEKDGVKQYRNQIVINNVEFFGKKEDGGNNASTTNTAASNSSNANNSKASAATSYGEYEDF